MPPYTPRGIEFWSILEPAFEAAAAAASRRIHQALRPRRKAGYKTRKPGFDSPFWNVCATMIKRELRPYGSKVQLARSLGIPRQRLQDFLGLKGGARPLDEVVQRSQEKTCPACPREPW